MAYSPIRVAQLDLVGLSGYIGSVVQSSQAVLVYGDQLTISGRKGFAGTIDFTGNVSTSGGINFSRTNYLLNQFGQFEVGANGLISSDPYVAQLYDLSNSVNISLDWNGRQLSGQWQTNTIPSAGGDLINLGYLNSGNFSTNPYVLNSSSAQSITGVKTFVNPPSFSSGATASNISLFSPTYLDGNSIYETNSGNNVSWSKAQLQNGSTIYLNWTGSQLTGANWKCDNFTPTDPAHIVNLSYLTGGGLTFNGVNTFTGISLVGGNGITLDGNLAITSSGSYLYLGSYNTFDPNAALFRDFSSVTSLDYSNRLLSGQWKTNNTPANSGDLINYSYFNANIPSMAGFVATTGNQSISGNKTLLGLTTTSGINISGGSGIQLSGTLKINQSGAYQSGAALIFDPNTLTLASGWAGTTLPTGTNTSGLATTAFVQNQIAVTPCGMKNRLINGAFNVNQPGLTTAADAVYHLDQWYALTETGSVTIAQQTDQENGQPTSLRMTQPDVTAKRMGSAQPIESINCRDLRGQTVALRARIRCSSSQLIRWAVVEWTGTADAITRDVVSSWTSSTFTPGNFFINTTTTIAATGSVTPAANTWTDLLASATISSSANNLIVFIWSEGTLAQNATLDLGAVQLAQGAQTPFEARPVGLELALAQRYYWAINSAGAGAAYCSFGPADCASTTRAFVRYQYPVPMRSNPSFSYSGALNLYTIYSRNAAVGTPSAITANVIGVLTADTYVDFGSALLTAGSAGSFIANNNNTAAIAFSSRL